MKAFPTLPSGFQDKLDHESSEYMHRLHERVFGADGTQGDLDLDNLRVQRRTGDGTNVLSGTADGSLAYEPLPVENLTAATDGILQGRNGRPVVDKVNVESLSTDESRVRKSLRSQSDNVVAFEEDVASRIAGSVNLKVRMDDPEIGDLENDATEYLRDGFRIMAYKTFIPRGTPDPVTGEVNDAEDGEAVLYKYMDLRDAETAEWLTSVEPPTRLAEDENNPEPDDGPARDGNTGPRADNDRYRKGLVYDVTAPDRGRGEIVDGPDGAQLSKQAEYRLNGVTTYRSPDPDGYGKTLKPGMNAAQIFIEVFT